MPQKNVGWNTHCRSLIPAIYLPVYRVVIVFIIIKIFFYICWYRTRQRQLAAYLSNPRNAQIVIVGGRAYLHQMCERQNVSVQMRSDRPMNSHLDLICLPIFVFVIGC